MERAIENVRFLRNCLDERTKNYEKDIPQNQRQRIFEIVLALRVSEKFLEENKVVEASFALMKYNVSSKDLVSLVEKERKMEVLKRYKELSDWFLTQL
ncbi:hypothetical protein [Brazilian marseillevirus]|uniref:hypothetical protein n=1 Tax=Brazilian marseillevirus TaxID=1813599 RepID=UPI0007853B57|nr:hypothetical protein A3303_gp224 [Brazilian marseillevirus]AMQ10732.1 hypothetical protein [Brazilian marseillevirus]